MSANRACWRSPSSPVSAKPAAKITANFGFLSSTDSKASTALPVRMMARSMSPGTSAMSLWHAMSKTVSRFGLTGWIVAPKCSAHALILRVMADVGLAGVSDAPMTATDRGRKKSSRSSSRSSTGRPVTSSRGATAPDVT